MKTDARGQRTDARSQMTDDRGRKTEILNAEVGNDMHRAESIAQGVNEGPKVQLDQLGQKNRFKTIGKTNSIKPAE